METTRRTFGTENINKTLRALGLLVVQAFGLTLARFLTNPNFYDIKIN